MDDATIFYIAGGVLTASAVVFSFIGLRSEKFPGKLGPIVTLWFIVLIGITTTFVVRHSQHEEAHQHEEAGLSEATKEAEEVESQ